MSEEILTKARLLQGKERVESVYIKALDAKVNIRPLDETDCAEAMAVLVKGFDMNMPVGRGTKGMDQTMNLSMEQFVRNKAEQDAVVAAYGLSCGGEKWTPKEVKEIKTPGALSEIAQAVRDLTGEGLDTLKFFRQFAGGSGLGKEDSPGI